jgi:drug/metabolite transporter (DMT)-like permease
VYGIVLVTQATGVLLLAAIAIMLSETMPPLNTIFWSVLGGIVGTAGIVALYRGLAQGKMGVVAPVSAVVAVIIPVIYSIASEGLPPSHRIAGFVIAAISLWLVTGSPRREETRLSDIGLALIAGAGFGFYFIAISRFDEGSLFWPLIIVRLVAVVMLFVFILLRAPAGIPSGKMLPGIIAIGVFDTTGNIFFTLASQFGRLDIAAVTSSLYPGGTVLLAWLILKERLSPRQWFGVGMTLAAIVLISA